MAAVLSTDPVCFARDANNELIIPLRIARGVEAVAILVRTVLLLWRDEWFLDRSIGTPWLETEDGAVPERDALLGQTYDPGKTARTLRKEILQIPGVLDVTEFRSSYDGEARTMTASCVVSTVFGDTQPITVTAAA